MDYSLVGYKGGNAVIPTIASKTNLSPVTGDNGPRIQAAINYVSGLAPDTNGFRGAIQLAAGYYVISNTITITSSGVVLRGAGDGANIASNTVLYAAYAGTNQPSLSLISNSSSYSTVTTHNITNIYVPVGARSFNVDSTNGFAVGTNVFVRRPSTGLWITNIGMNQVTPAWTAGSFDIYADRTITRVEGNSVTLDQPITCAIEKQYGGGTIFSYTWASRMTNIGVENIRAISYFNPAITTNTSATTNYPSDENHTWQFIQFYGAVANGWARNVTDSNFAYTCVHVVGKSASIPGARNITIRDCTSLDPISEITGGRRYAFVVDNSQDILVQNCYTRQDRHQFVTMSLTTGPSVFVDGLSDNAWNDCGPHFRWATGELWDNVITSDTLEANNYGNEGTSHGWSGANELDWNCTAAGGFKVKNPPTAQNWLIGGIGVLQPDNAAIPPNPASGTYDSLGSNVFPNSIYYAQLQDRVSIPNPDVREYWTGDIDQFSSTNSGGDSVPVDAAWKTIIQTAAGTNFVNGFDITTTNQWIPFSFTPLLTANDRIVGGTLSLAMRSVSGNSSGAILYLDSITNGTTFSSLGWSPIATATNTTVRVLDLGNQLGPISDGKLNLAVAGDVGIDWAMLELQIAQVQTYSTNFILPVADAYVRGGTNAGLNFGNDTILTVKTDGTTNNLRQGFLHWDLTGYTNNFVQARVRLIPVSVGTNGIENAIALVTNSAWNESSLTWSNEPVAGKRFATWIPATNTPVDVIVTAQVQSALATDGQLALEIFSLSNLGGNGSVSYGSRENTNSGLRPQLVLISVAPPQFTNTIKGAEGTYTFSGTGPTSSAYRIFATTNLGLPFSNWLQTASGTFTSGVFNYTDQDATNYQQRFYRIVSP